MKKFSLIIALITPLVLSSCAKEEVADNTDALKIQFDAEETSSSRAAIGSEGFPNGSAFAVWGYMTKDIQTADVFDGQAVTKDTEGNWNYDDVRYWFPGWNYIFYGVYPADISKSVSVSQSGVIAIDNFDCSNANDLMTAKSDEMSGDSPTQVSMLFKHLLAKVSFVGKISPSSIGIEGFQPEVLSAKIYGMNKTASYSNSSSNAWTVTGSPTTSDKPLAKMESKLLLKAEGVNLLEVLPFPQDLENDYYFEVTYSRDGGLTTQHAKVQLFTLSVSQWEAGRSYQYVFSVSADDRIIFDTPTVTAWDEAVGGITIVD